VPPGVKIEDGVVDMHLAPADTGPKAPDSNTADKGGDCRAPASVNPT
jgi:hypothetical protein